MSTAQEKWASMTTRERDAWVHQHVFGNQFWEEKRGEYTWVVSNLGDGREPWKSSRLDYQRPERYSKIDCSQIDVMKHCVPDGLIPPYTTDAAADYLVLKHVRETWDRNGYQFAMFDEGLYDLWNNRCGRCGTWEPAEYLPGDYSMCASLVLMESEQEQSDG